MTVYAVTWDLNGEKPTYNAARQAFVTHLERFENTKDGGLDSVRFISTTYTPLQVREFLMQKLDANDRLFIVEVVSGRREGWLNKSVWEWIAARS